MATRTRNAGDLKKDLVVTAFERRSWGLQRATWLVMLAIVVVAASGGLGSGHLSHANASTPLLGVRYDRILRSDSPSLISIRTTATDTVLQIELDSTLAGVHTTTHFSPAPDAMSPTPAGSIARWRVTPGDSVAIVATSTVHGIGRRTVRLRRVPGEWIALPLIILP